MAARNLTRNWMRHWLDGEKEAEHPTLRPELRRIESSRDELSKKWPYALELLRVQYLSVLAFLVGLLLPTRIGGMV